MSNILIPSLWTTFVDNAADIKQQSDNLTAEVKKAIAQHTIPKEQFNTFVQEFSKNIGSPDWASDSWINRISGLRNNTYSALSLLYEMHSRHTAISIEVTIATSSEVQTIELTMPIMVYTPDHPDNPHTDDVQMPITPQLGVLITPDMITALALDICYEPKRNSLGNTYTDHTIERLHIQFDDDLLDLAVHQFVSKQPRTQHAHTTLVNLDQIKEDIVAELHHYLNGSVNLPTSSRVYAVALLWQFQQLTHYSHQTISSLCEGIYQACVPYA